MLISLTLVIELIAIFSLVQGEWRCVALKDSEYFCCKVTSIELKIDISFWHFFAFLDKKVAAGDFPIRYMTSKLGYI